MKAKLIFTFEAQELINDILNSELGRAGFHSFKKKKKHCTASGDVTKFVNFEIHVVLIGF